MLILLALLTGCMRDLPLPDVGACAVYPEGSYDYGEIGIGTCLAGPVDLAVADNDGDPVLLVSNSNHLGTFTGGSLLAIPWDALDLDQGRQVVSDLGPAAVDLPDFAAGIALWDQDDGGLGDLALVANRLSEGSGTRAADDAVYLVDVTQARSPALSDRGDDGGASVQVQADPTEVVVDPDAGMAYVINRTAHSVSVLDLTGELVEIVLPWPEQSVGEAVVTDQGGDGSTLALADLEVTDSTLVPDEEWVLTWSEGTWRVWTPTDAGLLRVTTAGDGRYTESKLGGELDPADLDGEVVEVLDPTVLELGGVLYLYFVDQGTVRVALADTALVGWAIQETQALSLEDGAWDAQVEGPTVFQTEAELVMLYGGTDGLDGTIPAIGRATSSDGVTFVRGRAPVLEPTWDHEAQGVTDPSVAWDGEIGQWRMVYGAWDGERWTVGHATSDDTQTWTSDAAPLFEVDGVDVAAPVLTWAPGGYRMWYARDEGGGWTLGAASSVDGWTWTDLGTVADLDLSLGDPPGPAVQQAVDRLFRVERSTSGAMVAQMEGGATVALADQGLELAAIGGYHLGTDAAGADSAGGLSLASVDPADGTAWFTIVDDGGTPAIAVGQVDGAGGASVEAGSVLQGEESWEDRGVSDPVVVPTDDGYVMFYQAHRRDESAIARATSVDGRTWTRTGRVLTPGEDWDSVDLVPGSVRVEDDGTWRLFFSGGDGETWYIGEATSTDQGQSWSRDTGARGYALATGSPGDWDDSGVRDPFVHVDGEGTWHLWYTGFDGDTWRLGYATRGGEDESWVRFEDPVDGEKRAVVDVVDSAFHPDGAVRPVVLSPDQAAGLGGSGDLWQVWYAGRMDTVDRQGRAVGRSPDRLHRVFRGPSAGDQISFVTQRGDEEAQAIPLVAEVEGASVTADSVASLHLDRERGFLYVVGKERPYVFVIDVRDDSPLADGSSDANYLDLEAVIAARNASGADGFRQVLTVPGRDHLLALNDSPDAVWVVDLSQVTDDGLSDLVYDAVLGYIPTPRGVQRDEGVNTMTSMGVGQMLLHPDGRRLFLSHFNANSIGLIDLSLGPWGTFVQEVMDVGENPFAIELSPDGQQLVFANYTGEVDRESKASASTLGVLDIDEDSPTWFEVRTWLVNR
ncbi:hypothetical protein L6R53_19545 [Myxococcota bacterium]|nr:hypothetical protein [Myxococcota bacterium]